MLRAQLSLRPRPAETRRAADAADLTLLRDHPAVLGWLNDELRRLPDDAVPTSWSRLPGARRRHAPLMRGYDLTAIAAAIRTDHEHRPRGGGEARGACTC
jgi:hypothetical protein